MNAYLRPTLALVLVSVLCAPPARADHDGPTFEHECQKFNGNPDGSDCTWTNPANGKKYLVSSDEYKHGPPHWGGLR